MDIQEQTHCSTSEMETIDEALSSVSDISIGSRSESEQSLQSSVYSIDSDTESTYSDTERSSLTESSESQSSGSSFSSTVTNAEKETVANSQEPIAKPESEQLLYDGADLTVMDSYLLLYQFSLRHCLTKQAFSELISLVDTHLPRSAKTVSSVYMIRKFFEANFNHIESVVHTYCSKGHRLSDDSEAATTTCKNRDCGVMNSNRTFLYVSIEQQLKNKLEDPLFWNHLQRRHNDTALNDGLIHDISGGSEYKKLILTGYFSCKANVTLTINTDGVDIFSSSKFQLWPVWLQINELPPTQRYSKQNMLLAGLWYDKEKPTMTTFLRPVMLAVNELYNKGITVNTPDGTMSARAAIVLCCVDLPAQAKVLNMKQYNGQNGCHACEEPGVSRPAASGVRDWPYTALCVERTHESVKDCARQTLSDGGKPVMGIKGASILLLHPPFDIVKGVAIDNLHTLFLGVVHDLLKFWFSKDHRRHHYSIYSKIQQCDARLLSINVPDTISRQPKTLEDFKHWKGAQLREWLLYFSLPVLKGMLPTSQLQHYSYLVTGAHIVHSDSISEDDLILAEQCFRKFYSQHSTIYGTSACTMKVHLVNHIVPCVRRWGPLWAYSCFQFEAQNHTIKKFFHGTRNTSKELAFNLTLFQALPSIITACSSDSSLRVSQMHNRMSGKQRNVAHLQDGTLLNTSVKKLSEQKLLLVAEQLPDLRLPDSRVTVGYRLVKNKQVFFSSKYKRVKARNSYTVKFADGLTLHYGIINFFVSVSNEILVFILKLKPKLCTCSVHFGISDTCLDDFTGSKIVPLEAGQSTLVCIKADQLVSKCVFIDIKDSHEQYIVSFPNSLLQD